MQESAVYSIFINTIASAFSVNNALRLSPTIMKGGGQLNEPPCYEDELVLFFSTIIISNNIEHGFNMS
jgi:hypothetical protein